MILFIFTFPILVLVLLSYWRRPKGLGLEKRDGVNESLKADCDSVLFFALEKARAYGRGDIRTARRAGSRA